ncbi:septum formation inhibitor Maf [Microbulbifer salipaludis]|uniref:7-methyl-GTP pyrophosphatase n=1 Tax=Microbulbifer salipaludis TaxID=187980 RepID=A0ABS3E843_9GAMM|nr:nucleoside triphosphate pyrophosphatase [Microbulbifer salipaludis]MBN8431476.1 septum formation inhibitor Maf [Microbulbifer salipaludis]
MRQLILASSSPYRRSILEKLQLPFESASPHINEEALPGESAPDLASRLATEKARALCAQYPDAIIIGSDQVAECRGKQLGKPGSQENAIEQLLFCAGQTVTFHTGLCVMDSGAGTHTTICEPFRVHFRPLDAAAASRYVELDQPLDCAGSFKAEGLGIALFEKMEGNDHNTLIGLPLIRLIELLKPLGLDPLRRK